MAQKYNLRSGKKETVLPVQLQLCDDQDFMSQVLGGSHPTPAQRQVHSDLSSGSDFDISDLVQSSDNDKDVSDTEHRSYDKFNSENQVPDDKNTSSTQQVVNQTILEKLEKISARLDTLEQKSCKKSVQASKIKNKTFKKSKQHVELPSTSGTVDALPLSKSVLEASSRGQKTKTKVSHVQTQPVVQVGSDTSIPSLQAIKCDHQIQAQVDQRLRELADIAQTGTSNKVKYQRGGQVDVFVRTRVKWPHEFVLSGSSKERTSYDQLTMPQWMAGFCRTMREETNQNLKDHMLNYLIDLMDDANDFSWSAAKASHAVLLCQMEQGEVTGYDQVDRIDRIRRANAQKHVVQTFPNSNSAQYNKKSTLKVGKTMPCQLYNQNSCSHTSTHETKGVLYKHICSHCFTSANRTFSHSEMDCRNKKKILSKNEDIRA